MHILIIGGTRFIGPYVVRNLVEMGHEVTLFHRGRTQADLPVSVEHILGDRHDLVDFAATFRHIAPEVVLDMIPLAELDAQVVMETFKGIARRVVAISSQDVYRAYGRLLGTEPGPLEQGPFTEEALLRERLYPYRGQSERLHDYDKIPVERVVMGEAALPGTVLRLPMVYGPGDPQHRLFPYLKRMDNGRSAILLGESLARWRWSRGYVEDVANAIALAVALERAAGRVYNVGEPEALSMTNWVRAIGRAAGWDGRIVVLPEERLPEHLRSPGNYEQNLTVDTSRIRSELGYTETFSREGALRRTVAWERAHPPEHIDQAQFDYTAEDRVLEML
jgi:nucleoside-diphosphate-sugar epimerase